MSIGDDDLLARDGLPEAYRYLLADCPRAGWSPAAIHATASHWLEIHRWFRGAL